MLMRVASILLAACLIAACGADDDSEPSTDALPATSTVASGTDQASQLSKDASSSDSLTTEPPATTTSTRPSSSDQPTSYEDLNDIEIFQAADVSPETMAALSDYIDYSEQSFFELPGVIRENLYPIIVLQVERGSIETAFDLEDQYCSFLELNYPRSWNNSRCNPDRRGDCTDNICLVTYDGRLNGSSISGIPAHGGCCWLFISESHDHPLPSMGYVTIHEMFHIFQISNYLQHEAQSQEMGDLISGRISGDGPEHKPWWIEGNAVFFSHVYYARSIDDFRHLQDEMLRGLYSPYGPGDTNVIDRYFDGPELYNVTWESDANVGYQVGAWFVAYLADQVGESKLLEFWINTQSGDPFEENFLSTFGGDYRAYVDEFDAYLRSNDQAALLELLPTS